MQGMVFLFFGFIYPQLVLFSQRGGFHIRNCASFKRHTTIEYIPLAVNRKPVIQIEKIQASNYIKYSEIKKIA